jgi:hypothetical protein
MDAEGVEDFLRPIYRNPVILIAFVFCHLFLADSQALPQFFLS